IIRNKAMVYFPEIFSNRGDKFSRLAIWLITREAIVCPNIRDLFTAGGQEDYQINNDVYKDIPRIYIKLFDNINSISEFLENTRASELSEYWGKRTTEKKKKTDWINLVSNNTKTVYGAKHLNLNKMLNELMSD